MQVTNKSNGQRGTLVSTKYSNGRRPGDCELEVRELESDSNLTWLDKDTQLHLPNAAKLAGDLRLVIVQEQSVKGHKIRANTQEYQKWAAQHPDAAAAHQKLSGGYAGRKILLWSNDTKRSTSYMRVRVECQVGDQFKGMRE